MYVSRVRIEHFNWATAWSLRFTWDRHEMRRQLKVFHIQSTFSMLHICRWPFRYEPNHHGHSSTAGDVFCNLSFCNGMCYTFPAVLPPFWEHCKLLRMPDRWRSAPWAQKLRPVWKFLRRSKVDPVWDFRFGLSTETSHPGLSWVLVPVSCNQIKGFVWGPIWTRPDLSSSRSHVITL